MLLRICLILTILAGLATAYVGFFPVREIITTTREARDDFHTKLTAETQLQQKTQTTLNKTKKELDATTAKLTETQAELDAANTKIADLDKQTTDLTDKLAKMTARYEADEQILDAWRQLPSPDQIKAMISELTQTKKERDTFVAENKILLIEEKNYQSKYEAIFGGEAPVLMRPGLKGKVLAVDPKYAFVVLNIGEDQGAKERGEMMVDRAGKLIGKIRITTVKKDQCVATILSAWKRGEVMEGDQVIY